MNPENIHAELSKIAPLLAEVPKKNVYSVPDGYFGDLQTNLLQKLKGPTTAIRTKSPFSAPTGYFDNLSADILSKIKAQDLFSSGETNELAETPILRSIPRRQVYSVPGGYFEGLRPMEAVNAPAKIQAVIYSIRKFTRYVAAAVITGLLAVAGGSLINQDQQPEGGLRPGSGKVADFNPSDVRQLSEHEINEFLVTQSTRESGSHNNAAAADVDIKDNLQEIPVEDIKEYLKENPLPGEANSDG